MSKMKLFPKTFLYMLVLMVLITLIGHALIYFLLPMVYTNQKKNMTQESNHQMVQQLKSMNKYKVNATMEQYVQKNQVLAHLNYNGKEYIYGAMYIENMTSGNGSQYSFQASAFSQNTSSLKKLSSDTVQAYSAITNNLLFSSAQFIKMDESFLDADGKACHLETVTTLQPVNEAKGVVFQILPFTLLICLVISTLFALLYSKRITKPIQCISKATERMEKLDKLACCEVSTTDEIGQLAENINDLYQSLLSTIGTLQEKIDHVSEVEQSKVDFMRAASHELKTPVTAVSFMLDNMIIGVGKFKDYKTYLPKCKELIEKLSDMICDILDTSKLNFSSKDEEIQDIPLGDAISTTAEPFLLIAKTKGLFVNIDLSKAFLASVPPKAFSKVLSNVFSNAVHYTSSGGKIHLFFEKRSLIIENECVPLTPSQLEHIFEPFYRPDFSRTRNTGGSGLGLYIISQILSAYQIFYSFTPYKQGMRFTITF